MEESKTALISVGTIIVFLFTLGGLATKWLWNYFMPWLFGLPELTFLESIGILILSKLLFGVPVHTKNS